MLATAALALALLAPARAAEGDAVDAHVEAEIRRLHVPGLSLAVVRGGEVVKTRGYGLADVEQGVAASPATVYEIGSLTKQFTAAAVLMLAGEGRLRLDDPLSKHLPAAPAAWAAVTLRHVLHHTSGIRNHVAVPGFMDVFRTDLSHATSPPRDEVERLLLELPLDFEPGESWAYDNTGYWLLGRVIERVAGRPYFAFLEQRIFGPLGMAATRSSEARPLVAGRARGYAWTGNGYENRPALPADVAFSAGGLLSTAEDMARWQAALGKGTLLDGAAREQLFTPARSRDGLAPFDYGFGWFVERWNGRRLHQHGGGTPGFSSVVYRFEDDDLTVVILTNHSDRVLDQLAIDVAGIVSPALKRSERQPDPDPRESGRLKQSLVGLLDGRQDARTFTRPFQLFLGTASGRGFWEWIASHGALEAFTFAGGESQPAGQRVLRYAVVLGGTRYWFSFVLQPDGRIAQVRPW